MKTILTIACALLFTGCVTEQKLKKSATEYFQTHQVELAKLCDQEFPIPEIQYIPGDTIVRYQSIIHPGVYIPCPEPTEENPKPVVKCPESKSETKYIYRTDTVKIADSRQIFIYQNELKAVNQRNEALAMENNILKDDNREAKNARNNWMWAFIVLAVINCAFIAFKIFK